MNTQFLLMAQYETALIPAERVAKDYFDLTPDKFVRKCSLGQIPLPLVRMEKSQKAAKGVHINDLAEYLDTRRAAARKECDQLASATSR